MRMNAAGLQTGLAGLAAACAVSWLPTAAAAADTADIVPHRAGYELRLDKARSGSGVVDVTGVLSYDWADSCDGWIIEQRYVMQVVRGDGSPVQISASYANWESKDGLKYRFYVKRSTAGGEAQEDGEVEGKATLESIGGPGVATFQKPGTKTIKLPAGTSFPTAHTLDLMRKAEAGEKFDRRPVFDGAEVKGPSTMSAFILPKRPLPPGGKPDALSDAAPVWPVSIAVFPQEGKAEMPEFEMSIYLQKNGVVPELTMNYGDFTVRGRLKLFEPLKKAKC